MCKLSSKDHNEEGEVSSCLFSPTHKLIHTLTHKNTRTFSLSQTVTYREREGDNHTKYSKKHTHSLFLSLSPSLSISPSLTQTYTLTHKYLPIFLIPIYLSHTNTHKFIHTYRVTHSRSDIKIHSLSLTQNHTHTYLPTPWHSNTKKTRSFSLSHSHKPIFIHKHSYIKNECLKNAFPH